MSGIAHFSAQLILFFLFISVCGRGCCSHACKWHLTVSTGHLLTTECSNSKHWLLHRINHLLWHARLLHTGLLQTCHTKLLHAWLLHALHAWLLHALHAHLLHALDAWLLHLLHAWLEHVVLGDHTLWHGATWDTVSWIGIIRHPWLLMTIWS